MSGDYQGRLSDITLCLTVVRARPLEVRGYMEWHAHVLPLSLSPHLITNPVVAHANRLHPTLVAPATGPASLRPHRCPHLRQQ